MMHHYSNFEFICSKLHTMVPSPNENLGRGSMGDSNPPNPLQTAYEEFQNKTPFVTRTLIQIMAGSYAASWILGSSVLYGLANISHFTILKGEIYRIFTSSLVNMHFFSLAFAALSFGRHGKHLESAIGSTLFAYHCVFLGVSSNILFIAFNFVMNSVSNDSTYLFDAAAGMWQIIFGAMATECVQAPDTSRRLFFCQVPTALYPLALLGIFVVLGQGLSSGNLLSLALGYALGYGYMDRLKPTQARITRWEESFLVNLTRKSGYIRGDLILGNGAWDEGDDYKGLSLPLQQGHGSENTSGESHIADSVKASGAGRKLGTSRRSVDPRAARLEALERNNRRDESV